MKISKKLTLVALLVASQGMLAGHEKVSGQSMAKKKAVAMKANRYSNYAPVYISIEKIDEINNKLENKVLHKEMVTNSAELTAQQRTSQLHKIRKAEKELESKRKKIYTDSMSKNKSILSSDEKEAVRLKEQLKNSATMKIGDSKAIKARRAMREEADEAEELAADVN